MARPREFDEDQALDAAIRRFADQGYEGTSTDDLLDAMGISRQSLYGAFGDKRQLYLKALRRYSAGNISTLIRILNTAPSPLKGIEAALTSFADAAKDKKATGCIGVGSICEFGRTDAEIAELNDVMADTLTAALQRRLADARAMGELPNDLDVQAAADFLASTFIGMKVSARAGASYHKLRRIARTAMRSLK